MIRETTDQPYAFVIWVIPNRRPFPLQLSQPPAQTPITLESGSICDQWVAEGNTWKGAGNDVAGSNPEGQSQPYLWGAQVYASRQVKEMRFANHLQTFAHSELSNRGNSIVLLFPRRADGRSVS
jgi:hypothetical protein